MFGTGFLAGLFAKVAGLGSIAKIAVATTTTALTMTVVGASTGVAPFVGDHSPGIVHRASGPVTALGSSTPAGSGQTGLSVDGGASVATPAGSASTTAHTGGAVMPPTTSSTSSPKSSSTGSSTAAPSASNLPVPVPGAGLPDVSRLTQVPAQVLSCLTPVLDLVKGFPNVPTSQIAQIGPSIVSCVSGIVRDQPLPSGLNTCVSQILGLVGHLTTQTPTGLPNLGSLDLTSCIPAGLPVPKLPGALPFMGGGFPSGR